MLASIAFLCEIGVLAAITIVTVLAVTRTVSLESYDKTTIKALCEIRCLIAWQACLICVILTICPCEALIAMAITIWVDTGCMALSEDTIPIIVALSAILI